MFEVEKMSEIKQWVAQFVISKNDICIMMYIQFLFLLITLGRLICKFSVYVESFFISSCSAWCLQNAKVIFDEQEAQINCVYPI